MAVTSTWPDERTLIPHLLRVALHARIVLDRYGLHGCGGPLGPVESLGFFARAHDVPVSQLLAEIHRQIDHGQPPQPLSDAAPFTTHPTGNEPPTDRFSPQRTAAASPIEEQVHLADTIYRPFFQAGIIVALTLGAAWGAWLLVQIGLSGSFTAVGIHQVNAHGHAQIFGWVGLFVMGFAYQAFPRFKHTTLAFPRLAYATLGMMLAGLVARAAAHALGAGQEWAWLTAVGASILQIAAIIAFVGVIAATWKGSGKPGAVYEWYIAAALGWFLVQAVYGAIYLAATLNAQGAALVALVSVWQAPLRDMQIHGFALLMILGVSQRLFHHFYGLPAPDAARSRWMLAAINLAVVGEIAGLILLRTQGPGWTVLWYGSVLLLAGSVAALVSNWHIFSKAEDRDRSLKFMRTAYVWLFVSLAMLVLLPAYMFGIRPALAMHGEVERIGFSHAYYGAVRHAITVGFVSMMIVGVAAKVVPTLNGVDMRRLSPLWGPFVLLNLGCALRVITQTLTDFTPQAYAVVGVSGLFEVTALALWGGHLWGIMAGWPRYRPADAPGPTSKNYWQR